MPALATTTLETSPSLDLCQGFAIIPALGTARASVQGSNVQRQLLKIDKRIRGIVWAIADVKWSYFMGLCGPAWAMNTEVTGDFDEAGQPEVQLNWAGKYGEGASQDGFAGGVQAGLEFAIPYDVYFWTWPTGDIKAAGEIRINLLKTFINALIPKTNGTGRLAADPKLSQSGPLDFEMFVTRNGDWKSQGTTSFAPGLSAIINVIDFIPGIGQVNRLLQKIGSGVTVGPVIEVGTPVTLAPEQILIGTQAYNNLRFENNRTIGNRNAAGDNAENPATQLILTVKQTTGIDIRAGIGFNVSVLKLINFGHKWTWSLVSLFSAFAGLAGVATDTEGGGNALGQTEHRNTLSNTIGTVNKLFANANGCGCGLGAVTSAARPRVVFVRGAGAI